MTSLQIREFSETIKAYVKENPLPLEVKRMVLEEITREVSVQTVEQLKAELNERDNKEKNSE
jgi:hypothetical protein